jgi:DNA repair protein SbcC/Rad50
MIPLKLTLCGFLSYREETSLDFSGIEVACISGQNGAGKSSLLDAITWALFGKARSADDDLITLGKEEAQVTLEYEYERDRYRIERSKKKGATKQVQLNVWDTDEEKWVNFSEETNTATQNKLERILRMDYDTFINASFFLQGKADLFAQQRPSERKQTLAKILELDVWDEYQKKTAGLRREIESDLRLIDGRLEQIVHDLSQEEQIKQDLIDEKAKLVQVEALVATQEKLVDEISKQQERIANLRKQTTLLGRNVEGIQTRLKEAEAAYKATADKQTRYQNLLENEAIITADFENWQQQQSALDQMDATAKRFNEARQQREIPYQTLTQTQTKLEAELHHLQQRAHEMHTTANNRVQQVKELEKANLEYQQTSEKTQQYVPLEDRYDTLDIQKNALQHEYLAIQLDLDRLQDREKKLRGLTATICPTCGQPLTAEHREALLNQYKQQAQQLRADHDEKKAQLTALKQEMEQLDGEIKTLKDLEQRVLVRGLSVKINSLTENIARMQQELDAWQEGGKMRLEEVQHMVDNGDFCHEERTALAEIDAALKELGYDPAEHETLRKQVQEGRRYAGAYQDMKEAKGVLGELAEVLSIQEQAVVSEQKALADATELYEQSQEQLTQSMAEAGDFVGEQRRLSDLRGEMNQTRQTVGGVEQRLHALEEKRKSQKTLQEDRSKIAKKVDRYKLLEEAFGKNGVPALLIEQSIPEIEEQANEILEQLTTTGMTVQLRSQREYKDSKRSDRRETLDIIISDQMGVRPYEMYSGGEAFRVNFAIRMALSRMLSSRSGARLQTLVIDEGFGSQDADGVQRLVGTINAIQDDFKKIFVITHLESLRESFPHQIEVFKGANGSTVQVRRG